jgi:hypothetical protein
MGEGKSLLYRVINDMKFNNLGQHQDEHRYPDGTIVRAKSVFGQNTIEIDVSKSVLATGAVGAMCEITFDAPDLVQPMRHPGEIYGGTEEVENVDYLKIYYTARVTNCLNCSDMKWKVSTKECTYSLENSCWGQIVKTDKGKENREDENGKFIIVKLFTENMNFSRTGLSQMNLKGWIEKQDGSEACKAEEDIKVDCCHKDASLRVVEIWWEDFGTCQPFIMSADGRICKMPASVPIWGSMGLRAYSTPYYAARPLYAIPQILGSCIPLIWTATGPIRLYGTGLFGELTYFQILTENIKCADSVTIRVTDRCGNYYEVHGASCCESAEPLEIIYTSLEMACGGSQILSTQGGCSLPGYLIQWSLAGGGTLGLDSGGNMVYTAPATNPSCTLNPTITVTDCCGNSASITLAVNCYTSTDLAFRVCTQLNTSCAIEVPGSSILVGGVQLDRYDYRCDGTIFYHMSAVCQSFICSAVGGCESCDSCYALNVCTTTPPTFPEEFNCTWAGQAQACNTAKDVRTDAMKNAGCCPINPYTGLPF